MFHAWYIFQDPEIFLCGDIISTKPCQTIQTGVGSGIIHLVGKGVDLKGEFKQNAGRTCRFIHLLRQTYTNLYEI